MGARVLVVDDSPVFRESMADLLDDLGYKVTLAGDGIEALASLELWEFGVVITDLVMPRLDGLGLLKHLRATAKYKQLPAIAMSALGSNEEKKSALLAGADAYLDKTAADHEVASTLARFLAPGGDEPK